MRVSCVSRARGLAWSRAIAKGDLDEALKHPATLERVNKNKKDAAQASQPSAAIQNTIVIDGEDVQ